MLHQKKKNIKQKFKLYNEYMKFFKTYEFLSLPLAQESIRAKSNELFGDPNPCFIHESAIRMRLLAELEEYLKTLNQPIAVSQLPKPLKDYISEELSTNYISMDTEL